MPLRAVRLSHDQRRRPLGLETPEILRALLDVNLYRNEVLADELCHFLARIDLGIQPSASTSHRGGAEVEQRHLASRLGLLQALIGIAQPLNFRHLVYLPSRMKSQPALFDSGDLGQGSTESTLASAAW